MSHREVEGIPKGLELEGSSFLIRRSLIGEMTLSAEALRQSPSRNGRPMSPFTTTQDAIGNPTIRKRRSGRYSYLDESWIVSDLGYIGYV